MLLTLPLGTTAKLTQHSFFYLNNKESNKCLYYHQISGNIMSGVSCKANGAVYPASSAMMNSVKKPKMEQIQADHELFLQAFESEISPFIYNSAWVMHIVLFYYST